MVVVVVVFNFSSRLGLGCAAMVSMRKKTSPEIAHLCKVLHLNPQIFFQVVLALDLDTEAS